MSVDASAFILEEIRRNRRLLERAVAKGDYIAASRHARLLASLLREMARHRPWSSGDYLRLAKRYEELAKKFSQGPHDITPATSGPSTPMRRRQVEAGRGLDEEFERQAEALRVEASVSWDDVAGLSEAKRSLAEAVFYSLARPEKPVKLEPARRILLFGPPGTGKTLLGMAAASAIKARFYYVSVDRILSRYVGDSPRMLSAVFRVARRSAPSIIFFDEVEVLARRREEGDPATGLVQTFLTELDGLKSKVDDKPVIVLAATNKPWSLDEAIISRFEKRIYTPLPDKQARRAIFEVHTIKRGFTLEGITLEELAEMTEGYSGRDIRNVVQHAITLMLRRANPRVEEVVSRMGYKGVSGLTFKIEPLRRGDFLEAMKRVKPVSRTETLRLYEEWASKYGESA